MLSVWYIVVNAINSHSDFKVAYPSQHEKQYAIAESFRKKSGACFECCAGAIDGILVWIQEITEADCAKAVCSSGKFFCGHKHKFGLKCQAICDSQGRFLEVSIVYPGSTSNCLAFEGISLFPQLEGGLLAPGLQLCPIQIECAFGTLTHGGQSSGMPSPCKSPRNCTCDCFVQAS